MNLVWLLKHPLLWLIRYVCFWQHIGFFCEERLLKTFSFSLIGLWFRKQSKQNHLICRLPTTHSGEQQVQRQTTAFDEHSLVKIDFGEYLSEDCTMSFSGVNKALGSHQREWYAVLWKTIHGKGNLTSITTFSTLSHLPSRIDPATGRRDTPEHVSCL